MNVHIYIFYISLLLNWAVVSMFKKGKINLIVSGIVVLVLAPIVGFSSAWLILKTDPSAGQGAGLGGAIFAFAMIFNGIIILGIGIVILISKYFKKNKI
jgi:hypothetical protein